MSKCHKTKSLVKCTKTVSKTVIKTKLKQKVREFTAFLTEVEGWLAFSYVVRMPQKGVDWHRRFRIQWS